MAIHVDVVTELDERAVAATARQLERHFTGLSPQFQQAARNATSAFSTELSSGINAAIGGAVSQFGSLGRAAAPALEGITSGAGAAALGIAGLGTAAVVVGKQFYDLGSMWDSIGDRIAGTTGKIGGELDSLTKAVANVGAMNPGSLQDIATIIAQLSATTDLPVTQIQELANTIENFNRISGQTIDIRNLEKVFRLFDITTIDAQMEALNALANASWNAQIPINQFINSTLNAGKAAEEFGLGFGQTAALLATFEQAGLNADRVATSLAIALKNLAKTSDDPAKALANVIAEIQRLNEAGMASQATLLAQQTFGRGYIDILNAITSHKLDVDSLNQSLAQTGNSINDVAAATDDAGEAWNRLVHTFQSALSGPARSFFDWLNTQLEYQIQQLHELGNVLQGIGYAWDQLVGFVSGRPLQFRVEMPQGPATLGPNGQVVPAPAPPPGQNPLLGPYRPPPPGAPAAGGAPTLDRFLGLPTGSPQPSPPPSVGPGQGGPSTVPNFYTDWYPQQTVRSGGGGGSTPTPPKLPAAQVQYPAGYGQPPRPGQTLEQYSRETAYYEAVHSREQAEARLAQAQSTGKATAEELTAANNEVTEARRRENEALMRLNEGTNQLNTNTTRLSETSDRASQRLDDIGAQLDQDFGISKGLPGIAENLTRFLANLAFAPVMGALAGVREGMGGVPQGAGGLIGMGAVSGLFGPQYGPQANAMGPAGLGGGALPTLSVGGINTTADLYSAGNRVMGLYALAASLEGTPYSQALRNDCSGMVSQLAAAAVGLPPPPAAQRFNTTNQEQWLVSHGFQPGIGPPGSFQVGWNPQPGNAGHTAATLPGGINAEAGGAVGPFTLGGPRGGYDPSFQKHAYLPMMPVIPRPFDQGGVLPPGVTLAINNTGGPEIVLPPISSGIGTGPPPGPPPVSSGIGTGPPPGPAPVGLGPPPGPGQQGPTQIGGAEVPGGYGGGINAGGGLIGMAESAAITAGSLAIDSMAPGAGSVAAMAAQIGIQEMNRAIKAGGQYAGVAIGGIMETLLPAGASKLAQDNWLTRIAGGLTGATPQLPNLAGNKQPPLTAEQVAAQAPPMPPPGVHTGSGQPPGPSIGVNIENYNVGSTEDRAGQDLARYQPPGGAR